MTGRKTTPVTLRPYAARDLALLERLLGDPAMTEFIGGPESPRQLYARHERYLASDPASNGLFTILAGPDATPVGWVGFWETEWQGETVWECGWHVLKEFQGAGVARRATSEALSRARSRATHRDVHAFPSTANAASNALCRALCFTLLGETEVEYPKGCMMRANDWCLSLWEDAPA